ncbi:tetratricopeptide repeat protein [Treponema sp. R80B11-R83G3]
MKKFAVFITLMFFLTAGLFAQQKYALVIGNGNYTGIGKLNNPVNDANDISTALQGLGFNVDKVLDANLDQMENAIMKLKNRLSVSKNSYGFLFYAGHGVQSGGENYLIPVGANIPTENSLRERAVSVQWALAELNDAGNDLNMVVLDACRDNPFAWKRSGNRGLTVVSNQPADSIIVYATSAGSTAADGTGRNGLFTSHLLNNLKTPGLAVDEVFKRTGADVARASNRAQIPAIYSQYFDTAYLGNKPQTITTTQTTQPQQTATQSAPSATAKAAYDKGAEYYKKGSYTEAISEFDQAIRLSPNYAVAYNDRGNAYYVKKDYDRAIADYNEAVRLDPNYAYPYYNRGNAYYDKNDYDRAIADYNESIRLDPNYMKAYYGRGNVYYVKKDYDRAIADYEAALRIDPNYANAKTWLENAKKAKSVTTQPQQTATQSAPSAAAKAAYDKGTEYYKKGSYTEAISEFDKAIRLSPNYADAYNDRGNAYHYKKDYDRAIADYNEAIRLGPNDADAYYNRANVYYEKNDYDRAIADYNEAIRLDPNYMKAYYGRGNVYYVKKDYDRAITNYEAALRIDPKYANAKTWLENAKKAKAGK